MNIIPHGVQVDLAQYVEDLDRGERERERERESREREREGERECNRLVTAKFKNSHTLLFLMMCS